MPRGGMGATDPSTDSYVPIIKRVGVRLFHKNLHGCTIVIIHPTRRYKVPFQCPTCKKEHTRKAIHLNLDDQGSVIVSTGVLQRLQECGMPDLTVANEVENPPNQTLHIGSRSNIFKVEEIDTKRGPLTVLKRKLVRG